MSDESTPTEDTPTPPPEGEAIDHEELARLLAARLGRTPVRDLVLQTMATFVDAAGVRLGLGPEGERVRDLAQARQAIETLRTLLAGAEELLGAAQVRPFREPLAALQLAYARAAEQPQGAGADEGGSEQPPPAEAEPRRPDAASKLWVPPGTRRP